MRWTSSIPGLETQGFTHGEEGIKNELLQHNTQTAPRRAVIDLYIAAEHRQLTGRWPRQSGQTGNQRRFACAIRTKQAKKLTFGDIQRNAVERTQAGEILDNVLNGNGNAHRKSQK